MSQYRLVIYMNMAMEQESYEVDSCVHCTVHFIMIHIFILCLLITCMLMNTIIKGGVNCISYSLYGYIFWVDTICLKKKKNSSR